MKGLVNTEEVFKSSMIRLGTTHLMLKAMLTG